MIRTRTITAVALALTGLLPGAMAAAQPAAATATTNSFVCESSAPAFCTGSDSISTGSRVVERNHPGRGTMFVAFPPSMCYEFEGQCWPEGILQFFQAAGKPCIDANLNTNNTTIVDGCSGRNGVVWVEFTGANHTEFFNVFESNLAGEPETLTGKGRLDSVFRIQCPQFFCGVSEGLQRFDILSH